MEESSLTRSRTMFQQLSSKGRFLQGSGNIFYLSILSQLVYMACKGSLSFRTFSKSKFRRNKIKICVL